MKEIKFTLQTSHKTTKWTDLLIEPEEMTLNGQTCERLIKRSKLQSSISVTETVQGQMQFYSEVLFRVCISVQHLVQLENFSPMCANMTNTI